MQIDATEARIVRMDRTFRSNTVQCSAQCTVRLQAVLGHRRILFCRPMITIHGVESRNDSTRLDSSSFRTVLKGL